MGTSFLFLYIVVIGVVAAVVYKFLPTRIRTKVDRYFCIED